LQTTEYFHNEKCTRLIGQTRPANFAFSYVIRAEVCYRYILGLLQK